MPHPESEHGLRVQLATALRECNALHVRLRSETERADRCAKDVSETLDAMNAAQLERDTLRAQVKGRDREWTDALGLPDMCKPVCLRAGTQCPSGMRLRAALASGGDRG